MRFSRTRFTSVLCGISLLCGCQAARVEQPLTQTLAGEEPGTQLEFWHSLAERPITSNDEAFHGLLLYLDEKDPSPDYAARVAALKARGLLPRGFDRPANEAVTRGTLAVAITKAMKIKGGLMLHLLSDQPRYAVRELMYENIYPPSTPQQSFSGMEFVGIIGRLEDWERGDRAEAPAVPLQGSLD